MGRHTTEDESIATLNIVEAASENRSPASLSLEAERDNTYCLDLELTFLPERELSRRYAAWIAQREQKSLRAVVILPTVILAPYSPFHACDSPSPACVRDEPQSMRAAAPATRTLPSL
jgi:hypothetical protein